MYLKMIYIALTVFFSVTDFLQFCVIQRPLTKSFKPDEQDNEGF